MTQLDESSAGVLALSGATRQQLEQACAVLREYGVLALPALDGEPAVLRDALRRSILERFPDADGAHVFWTELDDRACFDAAGQLVRPLTLHIDGPRVGDAVLAALQRVGLGVRSGPSAANSGMLIVQPAA